VWHDSTANFTGFLQRGVTALPALRSGGSPLAAAEPAVRVTALPALQVHGRWFSGLNKKLQLQ